MTHEIEIPETAHTTKDGRTFSVRRANGDDAAALLEYISVFFEEPDLVVTYAPGEFDMSLEDEEKYIESHLKPNALLLFALSEGRVIGSVGFQAGTLARTRHAGTFGASVDKAWRGAGIGTVLLGRLLAWAKVHPEIERVGLDVFATNGRAYELYRKLGFVEEGRRPKAIRMGDEFVDTIQMGILTPLEK